MKRQKNDRMISRRTERRSFRRRAFRTELLILSVLFLLSSLSVVSLTGCKKSSKSPDTEQSDPEGTVRIYYKNTEGTELVTEKEQLDPELSTEDAANFLVGRMQDASAGATESVFGDEQVFSFVHVDSNVAYVHFTSYTLRDNNSDEILFRAALTFTLTQLEGIDYIFMLIGEQQPVLSLAQTPVGFLSPNDFVYVVGRNVNNYKESQITLYFAHTLEDGSQILVPEVLDISYADNSPSFSIERYIVKKLIDGPQVEGNEATITPGVRILSVTVIDGICYVNLDGTFLKEPAGIDAYVTIYSIVNSLTELSHINSVQIMVNGSSDGTYKNTVPLLKSFERKEEYIGQAGPSGWYVVQPEVKTYLLNLGR